MKKIDPSLGSPLPERSYAEQCGTWKSFIDTVNDEFILAHLFGWFFKAFLFRDVYLCWIMSILFEILEMTFQHMLPNFAECWWDHIIIDILVCNWLGFTVGLWVIHKFSVKPYRWVVPEFEEYHWGILSNLKSLLAVLGLVVAINMVELNAFFLKFVLWVPPRNLLNTYRLYIWWSIGLPGVKEYYTWVMDKNCKRFGPSSWLCCAIMGVELAMCFKFGAGLFPAEHPPEVVYSWLAVFVAFVGWAVWWYGFHLPETTKQRLDQGSSRQDKLTLANGKVSEPVAASSSSRGASPKGRRKAKAT
jgi:phosphatidylserine synthase 2